MQAMKSRKFKCLNKKQKISSLLRFGSFLAERKLGPFKIMLYELNSFYVEAYFLSWRKDVFFFNVFESVENLQPYLKKIDLSELFHQVPQNKKI
jgi:hypothetical protein